MLAGGFLFLIAYLLILINPFTFNPFSQYYLIHSLVIRLYLFIKKKKSSFSF